MKTRTLLLLVISLQVLSLRGDAADWPQWRGPERNGISQETGLLAQWPEAGPALLWEQSDLGEGYSTPAVVGDRMYLLSNEGIENEFVQARNAKGGELIWKVRIGKVGEPDQRPPYPGARSTPTVDGDVLYVLGSDGELVCMNTSDGEIRWQKNVRQEFGGQPGEWAYSESPLVDGDKLICTPGGSTATVVALNKETGEPIWKSAVPGDQEAGYASVIVVELAGTKQYVQFLSKAVVGVAAEDGKFLWQYEKTADGSAANIPTPVARDSYVYTAAGRTGGGLVKVERQQGEIAAEEVYFSPRLPNSIGGAVQLGDYMYGTGGQGLMCVEFTTGEVKWQDRSIGAASVCFAEGLLYLHGENGEVALVEATPEAYRERGRFAPADQPDRGQSQAWTYPVIANGRLYIRDMNKLWCYDIGATASSP
ncbi:MAG: PQQ-binding-like beta-propeller repeat protein [Pirellulales bacterium]